MGMTRTPAETGACTRQVLRVRYEIANHRARPLRALRIEVRALKHRHLHTLTRMVCKALSHVTDIGLTVTGRMRATILQKRSLTCPGPSCGRWPSLRAWPSSGAREEDLLVPLTCENCAAARPGPLPSQKIHRDRISPKIQS